MENTEYYVKKHYLRHGNKKKENEVFWLGTNHKEVP